MYSSIIMLLSKWHDRAAHAGQKSAELRRSEHAAVESGLWNTGSQRITIVQLQSVCRLLEVCSFNGLSFGSYGPLYQQCADLPRSPFDLLTQYFVERHYHQVRRPWDFTFNTVVTHFVPWLYEVCWPWFQSEFASRYPDWLGIRTLLLLISQSSVKISLSLY